MLSFLTNLWLAVKSDWNKFETWVASWMPGFKTEVVAVLGMLGSVAAPIQEYITGLPLSEFMTGTQVAVVSGILFTLVFWFRGIGARTSAPNTPVAV